jgi:hypothetical protein
MTRFSRPVSVSSTAAYWPASPIRLRTVFGFFCTSTPLIRARPVSGPAGWPGSGPGGLARPVRAEQALHGPGRYAHVHPGQRVGLTEGLADTLHLDHGAMDPANQRVRDPLGLASFTFDKAAHALLTSHAVTYRIGVGEGPP